jgi:uncharacterized protein (DUF934 family)
MAEQYILDGRIRDNPWRFVVAEDCESGVPAGSHLIVPLTVWQEHRDELRQRDESLGVCLEPGEEPADIADDLDRLAVVAIHFPKFADGRGYSYARELRTRYNYGGEVLATGDVLRDQMFYLHRCGFNAFQPREDRNIHDVLEGLRDFTVTYQGDVHDPRPIYRRPDDITEVRKSA